MNNTKDVAKSAAEIADGEKRNKNNVIGEDQIETKANKILRLEDGSKRPLTQLLIRRRSSISHQKW